MTLNFVQENFVIGQKSPDLSPQFIFYKRGFRLGGSATPGWKEITITGVGSVSLVNAIQDGLVSLRLFGNTEQAPETYIDSVTLEGKCEQNGTPTPSTPVDIICNNGAIKYGKPITIDNTRNYAYINATGGWAWSPDSYSIALPVTVGKKYRIIISSTDSSIVGTIFRYGFTDSDPEKFKQSEVTPSPTSISIYDFWRGTPQDLSDVEVTATHPYMVIQFAAAYASTIVSTYLTIKGQSIYYDGTVETVTDSNGLTATAQPLLSVGDYKDTQEVISGVVTRNVGIKVLTGTEDWVTAGAGVPNTYWFTVSNALIGSNYIRLCSHFKQNTVYSDMANGEFFCGASTTRFNVKYDTTSTVEQFKQYLADQYAQGTPVIIVYPTSSATTETVSGQVLNKTPITYAGSLTGLTGTVVESSHTTPKPTQPLDIVANNGMLKASPQLLVNGNCANGITNWTVQISVVYTDSTDYALFTNQGSSISYVRCNAPTRIEGHKYAYIIGGKASTNLTWGSRNAKQLGVVTTTDSIYAGIDEFPSDGSGYPWVALPTNEVFYLNKNVGFRMYDLTALGLDTTITTSEQVIAYFGNDYKEPNEIYYDGTVETVGIGDLFDSADGQGTFVSPGSTATTRIYKAFGQLPNGKYKVAITGNFEFIFQYKDKIDETPTDFGNIDTWATSGVYDLDKTGYYYGIAIRYPNNGVIRPSDFNGTITLTPTGGTATAQPLLKVGDYKDVQNVTTGEVTRNLGVYVVTGAEDWGYNDRYGRYNAIINSIERSAPLYEFLCTHGVSSIGAQGTWSIRTNKILAFYDNKSEFASLDIFKKYFADEYAAGHPAIIVYEKETPTTESVTGQPLTIQQGTNVVEITQASIDNLELEVSYKAGVEVTVEEIEAVNNDESVEVTING